MSVATLLAVIGFAGGTAWAGDPLLARKLTDRAIEAQAAGMHEQALSIFDEAIAEVDHPKIQYFRAKSLDAMGRRTEALAAFKALIGVSEVEKYAAEIATYIRAIETDAQVSELSGALERERIAREIAEQERRAADERAEDAAVRVLQSRRSGLMPPPSSRLRLGPVSARMVPSEPTYDIPSAGVLKAQSQALIDGHLGRFDSFDTRRTVAGVLTVVALVGLGGGAGLAFGPSADDPSRDTYRQAGLAVGIVGVVAALAAAAVWPSAPPTGLVRDSLEASR